MPFQLMYAYSWIYLQTRIALRYVYCVGHPRNVKVLNAECFTLKHRRIDAHCL